MATKLPDEAEVVPEVRIANGRGQGQVHGDGDGGGHVESDLERLVPADNESGDFEASQTPETWNGVEGFEPPQFMRMKTILAVWTCIFSNCVMIFLVFLLPILCEDQVDKKPVNSCQVEPFSVLVCSHALHWIIHLVADQYLKYKHKHSRLLGYISFYIDTKNVRRTPFYLVSVMNAVLLVTVTVLRDYSEPNSGSSDDRLLQVDYLRGLMTIEAMFISAMWGYYLTRLKKFHKDKPLPDVLNAEVMDDLLKNDISNEELAVSNTYNAVPSLPPLPGQSRDDILRRKNELIEKQIELIRYLTGHIEAQNSMLHQRRHHVLNAQENNQANNVANHVANSEANQPENEPENVVVVE